MAVKTGSSEMCGIAGIFSSGSPIPDLAIERMLEKVSHRGPDAQTIRRLPQCNLGHARLSVIDLATGDQPMSDDTQRYWIIFNGEIYNYRDLRASLETQGWSFHTTSDTEVILRAYQQYGDEVPKYLNGQFAFGIWDAQEKTLFAARDRLGEKPFYFAVHSLRPD
jgi:asparagine synthase (glutamine-hydrolysing)